MRGKERVPTGEPQREYPNLGREHPQTADQSIRDSIGGEGEGLDAKAKLWSQGLSFRRHLNAFLSRYFCQRSVPPSVRILRSGNCKDTPKKSEKREGRAGQS